MLHPEPETESDPTFLGVMFRKSGVFKNEYWTVFIELDDQDRDLLKSDLNVGLKTVRIVRRAGILDLLPKGIDDQWPNFGNIIEHEITGFFDGGVSPTVRDGKPRVWIIPGK
jgi:hypothetical protein